MSSVKKKPPTTLAARRSAEAPPPLIHPLLAAGGHLVVLVGESVPTAAVRASVEAALCTGQKWMGMRVTPAVEVDALYVGPVGMCGDAERLLALEPAARANWRPRHISADADMDVLSTAGLALLQAAKGQEAGVTSIVVSWPRKHPAPVAAFRQMLANYKNRRTSVVVYLENCPATDWSELTGGVDSFVKIVQCEPSKGVSTAFATEIPPQSIAALMGITSRMLSIKYANGQFVRECAKFISVHREDRRMFQMRRKGATLEAIGEEFGLDKSNVKRRLDKLPRLE
jgi:hypothetical protein